MFSNIFGDYYINYQFKRETFSVFFLLNVYKNKNTMAAILVFTMGAMVTKLQKCSVYFVDLKNICLDIKTCFYYI